MDADEIINQQIEQTIFGDDLKARTEAEIARAIQWCFAGNSPKPDGSNVMTYRFNEHEFEIISHGSKFNYRGADGNDGYGLWVWHRRTGKPYEADVEAAVVKYRRKARNFVGDGNAMLSLIEKMQTHSMRIETWLDSKGWNVYIAPHVGAEIAGESLNASLCKAVALASLAAVRAQQEQGQTP